MPTALPLPVSMTAKGSIEPAACSCSRRSISICMRSGAGTVVYQSRHSSPSATASLSSPQCRGASGSSLTRPPLRVTGASHAIATILPALESKDRERRKNSAFAGFGEELLAVGEPVRFQEEAEDQGAIRCPRLVLV